MRKTTIIFGLLISLFGMGNQLFAQPEQLSYGLKIGLNAPTPTKFSARYAGDSASGSYTGRNGYLAGVFFRINHNRMFLQPETVWSIHRQKNGFTIPNPDNGAYLPKSLDISSNEVHTYLLAGYNMIKSEPYSCDFYAGLSLKWIYKIKYEIADEYFYSGKSDISLYAGVVGFSVNISKLYFDFRYEVNLPNTDLNFDEMPGISEPYRRVFLEKNENVLSFSCGVIF
jgi:hypothetical protein